MALKIMLLMELSIMLTLLAPVVLVAGSAAIGGWVGVAVAAAALVVDAWRREATWWLALTCWALLPVVWMVQAAPLLGEVTPELVTRTTAAHAVGLAAVIVSAVHVSLTWPRRWRARRSCSAAASRFRPAP